MHEFDRRLWTIGEYKGRSSFYSGRSLADGFRLSILEPVKNDVLFFPDRAVYIPIY